MTVIAHSGSFLLLRPHPPAQTHENTQVFMGRLLAVNGANYMVQAPICNSGDMTFPQALGALGEVLSREGRPRWVGRVAQRPPGGAGGSHCSRKARRQTSGRPSSPSATAPFLTYPFGGLEKQSFPHCRQSQCGSQGRRRLLRRQDPGPTSKLPDLEILKVGGVRILSGLRTSGLCEL